jgi:hypothetical protein
MEADLTREEFRELVKNNVLVPSVGKTFDAAEKLAESFLNPYIENNYIEGFDTDFDEDTKGFRIAVHFDDETTLDFSIKGAA